MATAIDVAAYILDKLGPVDPLKLQKLVYYCQAWSLVFNDRKLFDDGIEAWANGPAIPNLFNAHHGIYAEYDSIRTSEDSSNLDPAAITTVDATLQAYSTLDADDLNTLTRHERPWLDARTGIPDFEASNVVIDTDVMQEYYSAVLASQ